jgi:ssDNA-binding Zn-finger/Zn-ribbon topoisomerase 1
LFFLIQNIIKMNDQNDKSVANLCPKCGEALSEVITTANGKKLQRCSAGNWNPTTRQTEGCNYTKWLTPEPETLTEKCPKCGANLILAVTRFGKKLKKCSTSGWDKTTRQPTGCDFVEWIKGTTQALNEKCPQCEEPLVLYTSANGKKMKKCSTSGWDSQTRQATGCPYVYWLKPGEIPPEVTEESASKE